MSERYFSIAALSQELPHEEGELREEDLVVAAFAKHLAQYREQKTGDYDTCVISALPPEVPEGYVRLPHLVATQNSEGVEDRAMWEILSHERARTWLGTELPDQQEVEDNLPKLFTLRGEHRAGTLAHSHPKIQVALGAERYISILFVYQHIDLFRQAWSTRAE